MNFINQFWQLYYSVPHAALIGGRNENVEFSNNIWHSYNIYHSFDGGRLKDGAYLYNCTGANYDTFCVDCYDCDYANSCELCYDCFVTQFCYDCSYLEYCQRLSECHYCSQCNFSDHLFGCVGLSYQKYCIFNEKFDKQTYNLQVIKLRKQPASVIIARVKAIREAMPQPQFRIRPNCEKCLGDYIFGGNNLFYCFFTTDCQDSAYLFNAQFSRDCFDCTGGAHMCELCYQCPFLGSGIGHSYKSSYSSGDYLRDCHYCVNCSYSQNLFGCVNLNKARFCILNKQYSEKDYWQRAVEIRKELGWPSKIGS